MPIRTLDDLKRELEALNEVNRLSQLDVNFTSNLKKIFTVLNFERENTRILSPKLLQFLNRIGTASNLITGNLLDVNFIQYLLIHYIISSDQIKFKKLSDLKFYLNNLNPKTRSIFNPKEEFRFISYLDYFKLKNWSDYLVITDVNWKDLHLLDQSLPLCKVNIQQIFNYIILIEGKRQNNIAIRSLGNSLILKLQIDHKLREVAKSMIEHVLTENTLRIFLPSFLEGIVNRKPELYFELFNSLTTDKFKKFRYSIIYALGVCCPEDESCEMTFFKTLNEDEQHKLITPTEYIQILTSKQVINTSLIDYIDNLTKISQNQSEINVAISYVINNLEDFWHVSNFQQILKNVFVKGNEENIEMLNELMYHILEKEVSLAYSLLTLRFEAIGANSFLIEHWCDLVFKDVNQFQDHLTSWFSSDNKNVHQAMRSLCTIRSLDSSIFKFSQEKLDFLTSTEKLYIGIKTAGFVYSKDHLQTLLLSLTQATKAHEGKLLRNLSLLFHDYLIYNYRTTLDIIKVIITEKKLPPHLIEFYIKLDEAYQIYFSNLSLIENFPEIRVDQNLTRQIHFYSQQKFSDRSKEVRKTSISNLFTETPIHSLRWAIRRKDEKVHQPRPLGHFKTSIEFPSGEKLNPIYQESMRRHYQKISRHEINID